MFRYLNGTISLGLLYSKDKEKECIGYSDADRAGDVNDRTSTLAMYLSLVALQSAGGAKNRVV